MSLRDEFQQKGDNAKPDLEALDRAFSSFGGTIASVSEKFGRQGLTSSTLVQNCASLSPRHFDRKTFDGLPGFRNFIDHCFRDDIAFRIEVSHFTDGDGSDRPEASVSIGIDAEKPFARGAIYIEGDRFVCTMTQIISARDFMKVAVMQPIRLKKPSRSS